eukprot:scaffold1982_cov358-Pavlova_lutheri.AAC.2
MEVAAPSWLKLAGLDGGRVSQERKGARFFFAWDSLSVFTRVRIGIDRWGPNCLNFIAHFPTSHALCAKYFPHVEEDFPCLSRALNAEEPSNSFVYIANAREGRVRLNRTHMKPMDDSMISPYHPSMRGGPYRDGNNNRTGRMWMLVPIFHRYQQIYTAQYQLYRVRVRSIA